MGACCGKGSAPKDPDKAPYGPAKSRDKAAASTPTLDQKQTTTSPADAASQSSSSDSDSASKHSEDHEAEEDQVPEPAKQEPVLAPKIILPVASSITEHKPLASSPPSSPEDPAKQDKDGSQAPAIPIRDYSNTPTTPLSTVIPPGELDDVPPPRLSPVRESDVTVKIVESSEGSSTAVKESSKVSSSVSTSRYEFKKVESSSSSSYSKFGSTSNDEVKKDTPSIFESLKQMPQDASTSSSTVLKKTTTIQSSSSVAEKDGQDNSAVFTKTQTTTTKVEKDRDQVVSSTKTIYSTSEDKKPVEPKVTPVLELVPETKPVAAKETAAETERIVVSKTTITSNYEVKENGPTSPSSPTSKLPVFNKNGDSNNEASQPASPPTTVQKSATQTTVKFEKSEISLNNNTGDVIRTSPIIANVLITNGEAPAEPPQVETRESPAKSFSSGTSAESEEDPRKEEELRESVLQANLKKLVKSLLLDFTKANDCIRKRHKYQANTRGKLQGCLERWITGQEKEKKSSFRVIWGKAGIGKTCMACEMCNRCASYIVAVHFFDFCPPNLEHNEPSAVVLSLAHQMCDYFPNYTNMLPKPDKIEDLVSNGSITELWQALILDPLQAPGLNHNPDKSVLIVLDSLDDCSPQDRDIFFELLNDFHESTPEWAHLLVTVSDDNQLKSQLQNAYSVELKNAPDNLTDIKRYLRDYMSPYMDRISLDGGLTQLAKKTEGSFLCAYLFGKNLEALPKNTKIALREVDGMFPTGLHAAYNELFQTFFDDLSYNSSDRQAQNVYDTVLGMLVNIKEPIHEDFIEDVTDLDPASVLEHLKPIVVYDEQGRICLHHRYTRDWLWSEQEAGKLAVDGNTGRQALQECCVKWLPHIVGDTDTSSANPSLQAYALKHAVGHFIDVPRQQESVAKLLCSLRYIQQKLTLPDVHISHLSSDFRHFHYQVLRDPIRLVTLEEYMKRQPKLVEQIESYYKFVQQKGNEIKQCPEFTLNVAANYPSVQRIQQNARLELEEKPWIEDLTAVPETHCIRKSFGGTICGIDVSSDSKTIALVTKDDDYNLLLHFVNALTAESRLSPIDIKGLKDRVGLCTKFLLDNNSVFVGSLTTLVNTRGKVAPSGFDVGSVAMKEKFSIECCDVSSKSLACGVSTFPWGGRSLHMLMFDMKSKKCTKTLEVLKFRFGGSAQFGIRCCALSNNDSLLCTCVKQTNKEQLKVTIWSTTKWAPLHAVDMDGDTFTKCLFVGDNSVLCGGSVHIANKQQSGPLRSKIWEYKSSPSKACDLVPSECHSIFNSKPTGQVACTSWAQQKSPAVVSVWEGGKVSKPAGLSYTIRGLSNIMDMSTYGQNLLFITCDEVRLYNTNDLDAAGSGSSTSVNDLLVESACFLPKSDDIIVSQQHTFQSKQVLSVGLLNPKQEDMALTATPFKEEERNHFSASDRAGPFGCFLGAGSAGQICACSPDGNHIVLNVGDKVKVWNKLNNSVYELADYDKLSDKNDDDLQQYKGIISLTSTKDNLVGLVYGQKPQSLYLYDLKSKQQLKQLRLDPVEHSGSSSYITDATFLPHNGYVATYHKDAQHTLAFWNQRSGAQVSFVQCVHVAYAKASPASDRLVISVRRSKQEGELVLRNSDGRFNAILDMPGTWLPSQRQSDAEFSSDGTILMGVASEADICRVWNAGNGEVLLDLSINFSASAAVVGMLTNTHAMLYDERLTVVDIATSESEAVLPLEDPMESKNSPRGLCISPKGNYVVGTTDQGLLKVFLCHNFAAVKRKTTLQRMKSVSK